jgi:hypothetical protein
VRRAKTRMQAKKQIELLQKAIGKRYDPFVLR